MDDTVKITLTSCYYVPPPYGALSDAVCPSVRLSVCSSHLGQLGAQRLGQLGAQHGQATRAVRTADPSAHGRRSAAIGGGIIV